MLERVICLIIGYVFGCISPAYFIGKAKGVNIKEEGSGNAGTTNVIRVLGKKAGILCFIGDILKAVIGCLVCSLIFGKGTYNLLYIVYGALGAIIGHSFPFYLKFSGGKGIASTFGAMLMVDWRVALICFGLFIVLVAITKYVSFGSIISAIVFYILFVVFGQNDLLFAKEGLIEYNIIVGLLIALIVGRHHSNISRLISGTENKFSLKRR